MRGMPPPLHRARCAALGIDTAFLRRVREAGDAMGVAVTVAAAASDDAVAAADVVLVADSAAPSVPASATRAVVVSIPKGDAAGAARLLASGADDVVTARTPGPEVAARLAAAAARRMSLEAHGSRQRLAALHAPGVLGRSPAIHRVREIVTLVAGAEAPVRIDGEAGTGKTLVARALHGLSPRGDAPLVEIDAARLPPHAVAAALLGTGRRRGAIETARRATILVRAVDRLDATTQRALARWLRTGTVPPRLAADGEPVPEEGPLASDARLLVTSRESLDALSADGAFLPELAAALATATIRMPPLRDRPGDAALLLAHFLQEAVNPPPRIEADAAALLEGQRWPGNVAELRALAWILAARSPGASLGAPDLLPLLAFPHPRAAPGGADGVPTLDQVAFGHIVRVLALCGGARGQAAKALGIAPRTLYNHLRRRPPDGAAAQAGTGALTARNVAGARPAPPSADGGTSPPVKDTSTPRGVQPR